MKFRNHVATFCMAPALLLILCHCGSARPVARGALLGANTDTLLADEQIIAFRKRIQAAQVPLKQLALSAKVVSFGPEGRARGSLQLVLRRPNQFRLTVLGPHGPPLYTVACDGSTLTSLATMNHSYNTQPATSVGIAHHLGGLDVGLNAEDWLQLLLGELAVPEDAIAYQSDTNKPQRLVEWHWSAGGRALAARYDGDTGLLLEANITLADGRLGLVTIKSRDANHFPKQLALHVGPALGSREGAQDVELTLFDLQQLDKPLPEDTFVIAAPVPAPSL